MKICLHSVKDSSFECDFTHSMNLLLLSMVDGVFYMDPNRYLLFCAAMWRSAEHPSLAINNNIFIQRTAVVLERK